MQISKNISSWLTKPVAVFGAGVSGKAAADLVTHLGGKSIVYDEKNTDFPTSFTAGQAIDHNLVIASPGFSIDHAWLETARNAGCEVIGELDFSSLLWDGRIVAITGTNGKTTLVEFITHSLRYAGLNAFAVGNIGYPFAKLLTKHNSPDSWAVVEVSSFQAELIRYFRSDSTVWSNFSEDHLDRYRGMEEYFQAKLRLLEVTQPKITLIGEDVEAFFDIQKVTLPKSTYVMRESSFRIPEHSIFSLKPQRKNFQLASNLFCFWGYDPELLQESVKSFKQSPHRLSPVGVVDGVEFWNDSKATNFSSAEAAVKQFQKPIFWIGGGRRKGGNIDAFVQRIGHRIKKAFLSGDTAEELGDQFKQSHVACQRFENFEDSIKSAYQQASPGVVILFSPGFASQKPFRNYSERGNCFENIVSDLKVNLKLTPKY